VIEAELTAVLRDPEQVHAALAARATPQPSRYADTYYHRPDGSMAGHKLRVRTITESNSVTTIVTLKEPAVDDRGSKPEHETTVADPTVLHTILRTLGLTPLIAYEKQCVNYVFEANGRRLLATIATIPDLANETFLELETMTPVEELPAAMELLHEVLGSLGVTTAELDNKSYIARVRTARG
jgi:adenylate cyclase class 2